MAGIYQKVEDIESTSRVRKRKGVHLPSVNASAAPTSHTHCLHQRHFAERVLGSATKTRYDSRKGTSTAAIPTHYLSNFSFQFSTARS